MPDAGALTAAQLDRFEAAVRDGTVPFPRLRAAEVTGREITGHGLCTAMVFDPDTMIVRRVFSSRPDAYPVGGSKPKRDTAWGQYVLSEGRVFIGEGEAAIRENFGDHAVIRGMGLNSIVNVPVFRDGRCVGTVNFLWPAPAVKLAWVGTARMLALLATPDWSNLPARGDDRRGS